MIVLLRPTIVMTSSTVALLRHGDDMPVVMVTSDGCYQSRTEEGAMTVRCSWMGLTQVNVCVCVLGRGVSVGDGVCVCVYVCVCNLCVVEEGGQYICTWVIVV